MKTSKIYGGSGSPYFTSDNTLSEVWETAGQHRPSGFRSRRSFLLVLLLGRGYRSGLRAITVAYFCLRAETVVLPKLGFPFTMGICVPVLVTVHLHVSVLGSLVVRVTADMFVRIRSD